MPHVRETAADLLFLLLNIELWGRSKFLDRANQRIYFVVGISEPFGPEIPDHLHVCRIDLIASFPRPWSTCTPKHVPQEMLVRTKLTREVGLAPTSGLSQSNRY